MHKGAAGADIPAVPQYDEDEEVTQRQRELATLGSVIALSDTEATPSRARPIGFVTALDYVRGGEVRQYKRARRSPKRADRK